ncbi:hypothetical protein ACTXT7_004990 [Hymenolepis weldensis]
MELLCVKFLGKISHAFAHSIDSEVHNPVAVQCPEDVKTEKIKFPGVTANTVLRQATSLCPTIFRNTVKARVRHLSPTIYKIPNDEFKHMFDFGIIHRSSGKWSFVLLMVPRNLATGVMWRLPCP